jgi:hypothetical protein
MTKIDKRVNNNIKSILALRDLLRKVCEQPSEYVKDSVLVKSLRSQGATARYSKQNENILGSSINTLKRISDEHIDGGFQALDRLRVNALNQVTDYSEKKNDSNKITRAGLAKRVKELEEQNISLMKVNFMLLDAIVRVKNELKVISRLKDEKTRNIRTEEALSQLATLVSLNPPPFDSIQETQQQNVVLLSNLNE